MFKQIFFSEGFQSKEEEVRLNRISLQEPT